MPLSLRHELSRKGIHLASATVPVAYAAGAPRAAVLALLALAGAVAVGVEQARAHSPQARARFERLVGPLLRAHEHRHVSGATWMCAAYLLAVALFPRPAAVAAMLAVALGDAAAAVVGRLAAHLRHTPAGGKTWAGSTACLAATALGAYLIARLGAPAALACGLAAALAERPRLAVDDNVRIVLAAGATAWLAGRLA